MNSMTSINSRTLHVSKDINNYSSSQSVSIYIPTCIFENILFTDLKILYLDVTCGADQPNQSQIFERPREFSCSLELIDSCDRTGADL